MMNKKGKAIDDHDMKIMIDNMFDKADVDNTNTLEREEFYRFYKLMWFTSIYFLDLASNMNTIHTVVKICWLYKFNKTIGTNEQA